MGIDLVAFAQYLNEVKVGVTIYIHLSAPYEPNWQRSLTVKQYITTSDIPTALSLKAVNCLDPPSRTMPKFLKMVGSAF